MTLRPVLFLLPSEDNATVDEKSRDVISNVIVRVLSSYKLARTRKIRKKRKKKEKERTKKIKRNGERQARAREQRREGRKQGLIYKGGVEEEED